MEIFSEPDYYPSPSDKVILYSNQPVTRARRAVSQADIYALIVYLSSPLDPVSYPIFSDFFLVYRDFIAPTNLYDLLIKRFQWCILEIHLDDPDRTKIGNIALVRTFVIIRHWILNHFVEDFLPDINLRLMFIDFINRDYSDESKIIQNCIRNLKKIWLHCMKSTWDNVDFNEPHNGDDIHDVNDLWLTFQVRDISQLNEKTKRASRLSLTAMQGISNPDYRNQSVMSLFKNQENFQLVVPEENEYLKKASRRTPTMLLNPENNFNYAARAHISENPQEKEIEEQQQQQQTPPLEKTTTPVARDKENVDKPLRRKVSFMSKLPQNMSPTITDLDYPRNSRIDKIIPPTPAKKIELILNTTYVPEQEEESSTARITTKDNNKVNKPPMRSNTISSLTSNYIGPMSLLNKWKGNHSRTKYHGLNSPYKRGNTPSTKGIPSDRKVKPQMDNFVKYVISISSLDNHQQESNEAINLDSSKFDILSARTIDEVEFLLNLENNLLDKINDLRDSALTPPTNEVIDNDIPSPANDTAEFPKPVSNFSAMDNLDLYQTVSSIAQSVISLSNTLNMSSNNGADIVSTTFNSRRKVKSSTAALFGQPNNSSRFILQNQNLNGGLSDISPAYKDGPERLIFHASTGESVSRPTSSYSNILNSTPTKSYSPIRKRSSSPLKKTLDDLEEVDPTEEKSGYGDSQASTNIQESNEPEYVSYDSDLSISYNSLKKSVSQHTSDYTSEQNLRKKNSFHNLREFTFEDASKYSNSIANIPSLAHPSQPVNDSLDAIAGLYGTSSTVDATSTTTPSTVPDSERQDDISSLHSVDKLAHSASKKTNSVTIAAIRPSSGRISLIKGNSNQATRKTVTSLSPVSVNITQTDFFQKDRILQESENKLINLENTLAERESATPSIATTALFTSRHNSPRKVVQTETPTTSNMPDNTRIRLSVQPSIQSIISDGSFSSYSTFESKPNKRISLRSKFQEGIAANGTSHFETASTNKYIFEPDAGSIDAASPAKDMEVLKSKFMKKDDSKTPTKSEVKPSLETTTSQKAISQRLNEEALRNIADITDDTIQDDPLRVAMMKLEGTYVKTKHTLVTGSTPEISKLSKEVEMLNISAVLSIPNTPQEKRKSLLIQRRRQTLMNIPYTPPFIDKEQQQVQDTLNKEINLIQPSDIQKLLSDYKIHDPSLLASNNENHIPFILTYDSLSIAQQMTLIEKELLCEIDWKDLLDLNIQYNGPSVTSWLQLLVQNECLSGVDLAIARFNLTVDWIISEITITKGVKLRRNTIQRFIHVAEHCRKFQNYNTLMQIVLALNSTVVQKFIDAWRLIEPGDMLTWEELKKIPSLDRNYYTIRNLLNHVDPLKGCIPFIVVYLSDLSLNAEKRTWIELDKIINYNKFDTSVQIVKHFIQRIQWCKHYNFEVDQELLSKCVYLTALSQEEIQQLTE